MGGIKRRRRGKEAIVIIKIKTVKQRNHLVVPALFRKAGKHRNLKREAKHNHDRRADYC